MAMAIEARRFKTAIVTFTSPALSDFSCQMMALNPANNTPDGDKFYTYCADGSGEGRESADPDWSVTLRGKHDWTPGGISRYLHAQDGEEIELSITFDNAVAGWERTWVGTVTVKSPGDGGDVRSPQEFEVTYQYIGAPVLSYESS
jgi:hypothetical protein